MPRADAQRIERIANLNPLLEDAVKNTKLNTYITDVNEKIIDTLNLIGNNAEFDLNYNKLPLLVNYSPRVGGKSRRRNNKKNNKSRRKNQSKRQRK